LLLLTGIRAGLDPCLVGDTTELSTIMEKVRFSPSGELLAVSGSDGRLRIWETGSNTLKQELIPSSHLAATCTCLEWAPSVPPSQGKQKTKRKKVIEGEVVVMGTGIGSLLFYDITKAQLISHSKDAHSGKVTGVSWSSSSLALYSCGEDGFIVEWDVESCKIVSRWKGGKVGLSAVHVFGNQLLSAGQGITLWDLKTKTSISSFVGHQNPVTQLEVVPESDYFITLAQGERHLKIWSKSSKNSIATLGVSEVPLDFHLSTTEAGFVSVSVVTEKGCLHFFRHKLNGPVKKPMTPSNTIKIVDSMDSTKAVSVLTSFATSDEESAILFAYGSWIKLRFERMDVSTLDNAVVLQRQFLSSKKSKSSKTNEPQTSVVEVPMDVKHLEPGTDGAAAATSEKMGKKRKKGKPSKEESEELPMEERLTNLTIDTPTPGLRENNLAHLLSQGLHSKDVRILHSVLSKNDDEVICNTVRSLPVQLIVPLLKEIRQMLTGKGQSNNCILKWLRNILQVHSSYLMCCPSADDLLGPFMSLLHTRQVLYPKMCQLRGKLQLIKGHIEAKHHQIEPPNEALLVFDDESAGEEDDDDERIMPSESEHSLLSDEEDELGVEDESNSSESEVEVTASESEPEDQEEDLAAALGKTKKPGKGLKNGIDSNHVGKQSKPSKTIKSKIIDESSEPESMDEDG